MQRSNILLFTLIAAFLALNCYSASIKESTERTVVITADHNDYDKARALAYKKAEDHFGMEAKLTKEPECDKRLVTGSSGSFYHFDCTYYFAKVEGTEPDSLPSLARTDDREKWPANNEQIKLKIKNGADVNAKTSDGGTALYYAVFFQNLELVKILIAAQADLSSANTAIFSTNHIILAELLKAGLNPNLTDSDGQTLIYWSSDCRGGKKNSLNYIQTLLTFKAKPNIAEPSKGTTPLHQAIRSGCDPTIIRTLLDGGANPNAKTTKEESAYDQAGLTPLFMVPTGYKDNTADGKSVIDLLLKKGAKINAADADGCTALSHAGNYYAFALVSYLEQRGAKRSKCDVENDKARLQHDRQEIARNANQRQFCAQWADTMPAAARPRNSGDIQRACSNAWQPGTDDFSKCVQTWKDCSRHF